MTLIIPARKELTEKILKREFTFYDPYDAKQTRINANGVGAFNTKVEFGDIAVPYNKDKNGKIISEIPVNTLIKIPSLSDIKTKYGDGVFKVNDHMNSRFYNQRIDFALPYSSQGQYMDLKKRLAKNNFDFVILNDKNKIQPIQTKQESINIVNNMPQIDRIQTSTPIIIPARKTSLLQKIGEYTSPQPNKVRVVDFLREFPGAIAQTGKEIGQSIARSFFNVGQALYDRNLKATFKPQTKFQKSLVGEEDTNLERGGRELANIVGLGNKLPTSVAIGLGIVSAGLDIVPVGGGAKQDLKLISSNIAKSKNEVNILRNLKKIFKGNDEVLKPLAKDFIDITDKKIVEDNIKIFQQGIKNKAILQTKGGKAIDTTDPRNFKTAEDYIGSQTKVFRGYHPSQLSDEVLVGGQNKGVGLSVSSKESVGKEYARIFGGKEGQVAEFYISPNAKTKIVDFDTYKTDDLLKYKNEGFDVVKLKYKGVDNGEQIVLNKEVLKNKQQLVDEFYQSKLKDGLPKELQPIADHAKKSKNFDDFVKRFEKNGDNFCIEI